MSPRLVTGCLGLAFALLAGCGSSDTTQKEQAAPDDSGAWPPVSVLEVERPVGPHPRSPGTRAKAREFVEYVVAQVNYTLETTYVDRVLRNSRCDICGEVVRMADDARAGRRLFETAGWRIESIRLSRPQPEFPSGPWHYWAFDVKVHAAALAAVDENGGRSGRVEGRTLGTVMVVAHASRWQLARWIPLTVVPDPEESA